MKKLILVCLVVLFGCFACITTTKTIALKPGMPNTLKLSNGDVVYDLRGEWDMKSKSQYGESYSGLLEIKQNEDQFVGIFLKSGRYPQDKGSEKIKGKLKGGEVVNIQYMGSNWINSIGEIAEGGNIMTIFTRTSELEIDSTLTKR